VSLEDRTRWDRKHGQSGTAAQPSEFLRQTIEGGAWQIASGRALDLACGKGRNAIYLALRGFHVTAMDISAVALKAGRSRARARSLEIDWRQCDLEATDLAAETFDLIVKINYLQRSLIPGLKRAVRKGGHVVCDTYLIDQKNFGHPSNPDFLLGHNELLDCFRDFRVLCYREGKFADGAEPAAFRAGILAQRIG
jgi:SAM-dependent methyltransferase